jgi:putative redox protein
MLIDVKFEGGKKVSALVKGFMVRTDQDLNSGGEGSAPDPFTYFLSSIATCAGIYAKSFCDQRQLSTNEVRMQMETKWDQELKLVTEIRISIHVPAEFPVKYENALVNAVGLCTVKRHLLEKIRIEVVILR